MSKCAARCNCREYFLALTVIVMIVIILTAKDTTTAVILVGLIAGFLVVMGPHNASCRRDAFTPREVENPILHKEVTRSLIEEDKYPGAIDFRESTDFRGASGEAGDDTGIVYDGDELVTYQNRARNVPERVWAGTHQRKTLVDHYVREELDERENVRWWGAHEV